MTSVAGGWWGWDGRGIRFGDGYPGRIPGEGYPPMPVRPPRACTWKGYPPCSEHAAPGSSKCPTHTTHARRASDRRRESGGRRYDREHYERFRPGVLAAYPNCACEYDDCHGLGRCFTPSTIADHYPRTKRALIAAGDDPNDPQYGRGLCKHCHDHHTAITSPGGWNDRGGRIYS